jgi:hypothetical protein
MVLLEVDATTIEVSAELGVSDGEAMLNYDVVFTLEIQSS